MDEIGKDGYRGLGGWCLGWEFSLCEAKCCSCRLVISKVAQLHTSS